MKKILVVLGILVVLAVIAVAGFAGTQKSLDESDLTIQRIDRKIAEALKD